MILDGWRRWARTLKQTTLVLHLAVRHPETPWYARALAAVVVAYALSPIDLIPDPIPVLGYLDDLILLPLGIWLTRKLIPTAVWRECERDALDPDRPRPGPNRGAAIVIILLWAIAFYLVLRALLPLART